MRETPESRASNHKRDDEPPRSIDFNLSSSITWPIALPVTAEATYKKLTGDGALRNANNSNLRVSRGIDMVGKKSKIEQRETNVNSNPRFNNSIRCSKNGELADPLLRTNRRRSMGQGGEKSTYQHPLVQEIWQYLISKVITITAENLPTSQNVQADWESRHVQDSSEWKLNPKLFRKICRSLGQPSVDLFAYQLTKQTEPYITWKADPCCKAMDALQQK